MGACEVLLTTGRWSCGCLNFKLTVPVPWGLCLVSRGYWLDGGGSEDNATECMQYLFRYMPRRDMQVVHRGTRPTVM